MNETVEDVLRENGVSYHMVPTKKHKTLSIVAKFKTPLSKESITMRALLPYVLQQGTESYPSRSSIQLKLDRLYGAVLSLDGTKKGNDHIISIRLEIANQKYISDESSVLDEALTLLNELIFNPKNVDGAFDPTIISREKMTLKHKMNAVMDDKMSYANMRLIDEMCEGEVYQTHVHGYEDDLKAITAENLYSYYQTVLKEDQMDIYVLGDFDLDDMKVKMKTTFQRNEYTQTNHPKIDGNDSVTQPNIVIDRQEIQQAKLHLGYRTHCTYRDEDYDALQVFNGLFGGFPSSKLFINVREKNSLAYYAASKVESHKGLMLVFSGIAPDDYNKAKDIMEEQMKAMQHGDFSEDDIEKTKELMVNQLLETMDHPQGMIELLYQQVVADTTRSPEELINSIKKVNKEEIIKVANKIELDTVYLLTSEGGKTNE